MTPYLLSILCDPADKSPLSIKHPRYDEDGNITSGILVSENGNTYPVRYGIPRFTGRRSRVVSCVSDKEEHSASHQKLYKDAWLNEYVQHTFGSADVFKGKKVVDCGGGSGYQAKWMVENGADHVICIENSNRVDGIVRECMEMHGNIDIVQCSLDALPFQENAFEGMITCNDALQHARSYDRCLKSLWNILTPNSEIVLTCHLRKCSRWYHGLRYKWVDIGLRRFMKKRSAFYVRTYAVLVSFLHLLPFVGQFLVKNHFVWRTIKGGGAFCFVERYKDALHHTFEYFAGHTYEHIKTADELKGLLGFLQSDPTMIQNDEYYYSDARPLGLAIRVRKS